MLCSISPTSLFSIHRLFPILRCLILTRYWAAALITSISASTKSKVRVGWWSHSIWDISILKSSNYDFPYWRYSVFCLIFSGLEGLSQIFQQPFWWWASMCLWEGDQEINNFPHFYNIRCLRLFLSLFLVVGIHWSLPSLCLPSLPHSWASRPLPSPVQINSRNDNYI